MNTLHRIQEENPRFLPWFPPTNCVEVLFLSLSLFTDVQQNRLSDSPKGASIILPPIISDFKYLVTAPHFATASQGEMKPHNPRLSTIDFSRGSKRQLRNLVAVIQVIPKSSRTSHGHLIVGYFCIYKCFLSPQNLEL